MYVTKVFEVLLKRRLEVKFWCCKNFPRCARQVVEDYVKKTEKRCMCQKFFRAARAKEVGSKKCLRKRMKEDVCSVKRTRSALLSCAFYGQRRSWNWTSCSIKKRGLKTWECRYSRLKISAWNHGWKYQTKVLKMPKRWQSGCIKVNRVYACVGRWAVWERVRRWHGLGGWRRGRGRRPRRSPAGGDF